MTDNPYVDFAVQAFATLIGAGVAFGLEAWRQKRKERRANFASLNKALFILLKQRDYMVNLNEQALDQHRANPDRWFLVHPITAEPPRDARIRLVELVFLLSSPEGELLNKMVDVDLRFDSLVQAISVRNKVHLRLQEALGHFRDDEKSDEMPVDQVVELVGGRHTMFQLKALTDQMYDFTEKNLTVNQSVSTKVELAIRRLFPKSRFFPNDKFFTFKYTR